MRRRSFIKTVGAGVGAGTLTAGTLAAEPTAAGQHPEGMPRRPLGKTGQQVSIIGFPGLSLIHDEQKECTEGLHAAFDAGVNYFDVAPAYGNGDAEQNMGIGLQGIDRDKIFLACKTKMRDAKGAQEELERSLSRLKTDRFDLYQLHALRSHKEVQQALAPGGAMETFLKAREAGKVRFFGFSAHTTRAALTALGGFKFDTVMFPINFVEYLTLGFGKAVLKRAQEIGAGVVAIKPMCRGGWPEGMQRTRRWWYRPVEDDAEIPLVLRFTLSQQGVAAGFPPGFQDLARKAIAAARSVRPITDAEIEQLRKIAADCPSVFRKEEQAAETADNRRPFYPDSPHECCPGHYFA